MTHVVRGKYIQFDINFLALFICSRFLVYYYHKACPENLLDFEPFYEIILASASLLAFQIVLIRFQVNYGPYSIIPEICLCLQSQRFSYFVKKPPRKLTILENSSETSTNTIIKKDSDSSMNDEELCAICMNSLSVGPDIQFDPVIIEKPYIKRLELKTNELMRTPCNHMFHIPCLVNWMQIKMECPSCRKELPPVI